MRLRPGVVEYRGFRFDLGRPRRRLEYPSATVTVVFTFGERLYVSCPVGGGLLSSSALPLLSGMRTRPSVGEHAGRLAGIEVCLQPWAAHRLLGRLPMHEIANAFTPVESVLGGRVQRLTDALAEAPGWASRFDLLDTALLRWTADAAPPCPRTLYAWTRLRASGGTVPVRALAAEAGWSPRQLERRFSQEIGLSPKATGRVFRLQQALTLLTAGTSPAEVALRCRYYDQAHLNREFKALTGHTPSRFGVLRTAPPTGPPVNDRLPDGVTSVSLGPAG